MPKILYEAYYVAPYDFSLVGIIIILATIASIIFTIKKWKEMDIPTKFFFCAVVATLTIITATGLYNAFDSNDKVYDEYIAGNYQEVEGYITDYIIPREDPPGNISDSFWVNDVYFVIPGFCSPWGYPLTQSEGGQLQEGMYVRIRYIPYKWENVIMKIEQVQ